MVHLAVETRHFSTQLVRMRGVLADMMKRKGWRRKEKGMPSLAVSRSPHSREGETASLAQPSSVRPFRELQFTGVCIVDGSTILINSIITYGERGG